MKSRCNNPNSSGYERYGGRGISYNPDWECFTNFLSDMGERPENTSLERINSDGDYSKKNCRWATIFEQNRNTRTNKFIEYEGVVKTNQEWAKELNIPSSTLYNRIFTRGWSVNDAFHRPVRFKRK